MFGIPLIYIAGLWLLCGIAGALIAPSRGNTPVMGFVLGALLGPLGLLILIVHRPSQSQIDLRAQWEQEARERQQR